MEKIPYPRSAAALGLVFEMSQKDLAVAKETRDKKKQELEQVERELKVAEFRQMSMRSLIDGWKINDPGKYQDAFFFLTQAGEWAVVREFVAAGTKIYTKEEWRDLPYDKQKSPQGVPPHYKLIELKDALRISCPSCGEEHPAIEHYRQTGDSPEGDEWARSRIVLCPNDGKLFEVGRTEFSGNRMR